MRKREPAPGFISRLSYNIRLQALYYTGKVHAQLQAAHNAGTQTWRILRYERVTEPADSIFPLARNSYVRLGAFHDHVAYMARYCTVLPLEELLWRVEAREELPLRTVAITFDGGWVDTFRHAAQELMKYHLPATVFLPPAYIGSMDHYWSDKVMYTATVAWAAGHSFQFLGALREFWDEIEVKNITSQVALWDIAQRFVHHFSTAPVAAQLGMENALNDFLVGMEQKTGELPNERTFLNWAEVAALQNMGFSVGCMGTLGHDITGYTEEGLIDNINGAEEIFARHGMKPIKVFAAPFGAYTATSLDALFKCGYRTCLAIGDPLHPPLYAPAKSTVVNRTFPVPSFVRDRARFACAIWGAEGFGLSF